MIMVTPITDELLFVEDESYSPDRYKIINYFLMELDLKVLDYKLVLKDNRFDFIEQSIDVHPLDLDMNFEDVLKGLYENIQSDDESQVDMEDYKFDLNILCKKK
jgi:hypothetical protein